MKTNGVNIPGRRHWHCVCESSLGSETLWIHAGSQGAILDQSIWQFGRLHFGSCCLPYTPFLSTQHRAGQSRNRPKIYCDWSNKFGISTMFDQDIKGLVKYVRWRYTGFSFLQETLSSLISCLVSMWLRWWEKHKIQSTKAHIYTHAHSQDTPDTHIPTTPLSDCLSPSPLVSLSLSQIDKHNLDTMTWTAVCRGILLSWRDEKKKGWLAWVNVWLYASIWEAERERNKERNREKEKQCEKTELASIAK